ncbi:hypothetical protein BU24DRAFT_415488 [Aaosphaeria arxii CBS 175.79]|uniref:AA1-like domain-containing protein n=1 Tax=Aaosphaeria arxii CBS 175.79 TaxID=1450172 RepID=A0A6A5X733_9PLEO|nr:uncharacterized protein BU24DRAFT_415488 [Aaosphaeria arxii CBS 175.79]KAF2008739.1 hypothetical protein BU24DRAFT_415488 [Aaosphaeria arxii CBS 175.79]
MRSFTLLSALIAASQAQMTWPIHGCPWVTETTLITNFTLFHSASIDSDPDYVSWQVPAYDMICTLTSQSNTGKVTPIGKPKTTTVVPCNLYKDESAASRFYVSEDEGSGSNATIRFVYYAQCAASRYAIYYEAGFPQSCVEGEKGVTCVPSGNTTAWAVQQYWLAPIGGMPPPPPASGPGSGVPPKPTYAV